MVKNAVLRGKMPPVGSSVTNIADRLGRGDTRCIIAIIKRVNR